MTILLHDQAKTLARPPRFAWVIAATMILMGATILAGWWLNMPNLRSVWPALPQIPPNGGLLALLLGAALAFNGGRSPRAAKRAAGNLAALSASALALVTLLEYILQWNAGIDYWLFKDSLTTPLAGRLSFPGALAAFCLALGIAVLDVRIKGIWLSQTFVVFAALVVLLAVIGHVCNVPEFYGRLRDGRHPGMPSQATFGLLLLVAGTLLARPERGLMAILWSGTPGGLLARWLLLAPAAGLLLTAIVYLLLTHVIPVDRAVRTWAMGLANLFFVTVPIWGAAHALHRMGLERERAHQQLEDRVRQRTAELSEARDRLQLQAFELEQRVQERTAKLAESVADLEAFSYSVAHDMRAPLRGMQGFAQLLLEEHAAGLDPEARDYLARIASSAVRMDQLLQDALGYTQVLRSETELNPVDLDQIVRQLIAAFPAWQAPRAEVTIIGQLPMALGHEGLLVRCLSNLITNAIKFVAPGTTPHVRVWAEILDTHVRLHIEDNGIGIAARDRDRIFRIFERLNPAQQYEGTGIGLAIVRKTVERMKARVDFDSTPGRGTRFWIDLNRVAS